MQLRAIDSDHATRISPASAHRPSTCPNSPLVAYPETRDPGVIRRLVGRDLRNATTPLDPPRRALPIAYAYTISASRSHVRNFCGMPGIVLTRSDGSALGDSQRAVAVVAPLVPGESASELT
jgi:hypothetical protein